MVRAGFVIFLTRGQWSKASQLSDINKKTFFDHPPAVFGLDFVTWSADFPETSPSVRVFRGRHSEVGIVEFGLYEIIARKDCVQGRSADLPGTAR